MKAVFDTNILIDYLNGISEAKSLLGKYQDPWISIITKLEVLVGVQTPEEDKVTRRFLARFKIQPVDDGVCERSVEVRRSFRMRVPDAIIYATAREQGSLLVTRNTKDFPPDEVDVLVPYQV